MYVSFRNLLRSDGPMLETGTLNTGAGVLLTTDDVLQTLQMREKTKSLKQKQRKTRQAEAASRRAAQEETAANRVRLREDAK